MSSNSTHNDMYIYNLPYSQHRDLCRILDRDMRWEELAGRHMNFDMMTIYDLRRDDQRGSSPTSQLLTMWGQQNHTVAQLFVLLSKMHHYQAMTVLKPSVDSRYHALINEGEENISVIFDKEENAASNSSHHNQNRSGDRSDGEGGPSAPGASGASAPAASGPGAVARSSNSQVDKNFGSHNFNVPIEEHDRSHYKVLLPPVQQAPEIKILNTPMPVGCNTRDIVRGNFPVPRVTVNSPSSDLQPLQLVNRIESEDKENNNPVMPVRKLSSGSVVSSLADASIPLIQYAELGKATNNWDKSTIIGKGGFGTVFKGIWKNTRVAIKRIEQRGAESIESHRAQMEQSLRELRTLNACRHDNILPLYGFSGDGPEPCLVYQFMPHGSLEDRLLCRQGSAPLTWLQRHDIARGTARGLQFLHAKPFVHGDIKSANILLDNNFEPKIGDFGLAREGPESERTHKTISRVHGTLPYLPHDFLRNKQMSPKVDTYSYGIVLFELVTGLRAYDEGRREKFLIDHVTKWDPDNILQLHDRKPGMCDMHIFKFVIDLGKECVSHRPRERPLMEQVLERLEGHRRHLCERTQSLPLRISPRSPVPVGCELLTHLPEPRMIWSPKPVSPEAGCIPMSVAVGNCILSPSMRNPLPPQLTGSPSPVPFPKNFALTVHEEESQSSVGSSEESVAGAAAVCPASEANDDGVPLLSALGIKDTVSKDGIKDTLSEDITAIGKEPLTVFQ